MKKILIVVLFLFGMSVNGIAQSFDASCDKLFKSIVVNVDKDPRTFAKEIDEVEKRISSLDKKPLNSETATQKAVLHCFAAWAYRENDNFRNADANYAVKSKEHMMAALTDKELLAMEPAFRYKALVNYGLDGALFNHSMLAVVAQFYIKKYGCTKEEKSALYRDMISVYQKNNMFKASDVLEDELRFVEIMEKADLIYDSENYADDENRRYARLEYWQKVVENNLNSRFIGDYKNNLNDVLRPWVSLEVMGNILPGKDFDVKVKYWNCDKTRIVVRKFNGYKRGRYEWQKELRVDGKVMKTFDFVLGNDEKNVGRKQAGIPVVGECTQKVEGLPVGKYVFVYKCMDFDQTQVVDVSSVRMVAVHEDDNIRVYTLDAITGQPIANVNVSGVYESNDRKNARQEKFNFVTDQKGESLFPFRDNRSLKLKAVRSEGDSVVLKTYFFKNIEASHNKSLRTELFTERSLYRPGQTVKIAGVFYREESKDLYVPVAHHASDVTFKYCGDEEGGQKVNIKSNDFGSFDCEFKIPDDAKVGSYLVMCGDARAVVRVEEYKRPTWELTLKGMSEGRPAMGDSMIVNGTAQMFAGVAVSGAAVEYNIYYSPRNYRIFRPWTHYDGNGWRFAGTGTTVSDAEGKFSVVLPLVCPPNEETKYMNFKVVVKVTDMAGETHESEFCTTVSSNDFVLTVDAKDVIDLNSESNIVVSAVDVLGKKHDVKGKCEVKLNDELFATVDFETNKPYTLSSLCGLKASAMAVGDYTLCFQTVDSRGNKIDDTVNLRVFDSNKNTAVKRKSAFKDDFLYCPDNTISADKPAHIYFCPVADEAYIVRYVSNGKRVFERKTSAVKGGLNVYEVKYDTVMHDGAQFSVFYIKDGKLNEQGVKLVLEEPNKHLQLAWKTFRDYLQPGQKEQWTLTVKSPDGKNVPSAELFATMYDASLDAIRPFKWDFSLSFPRSVGSFDCKISSLETADRVNFYGNYTYSESREYYWDEFYSFYAVLNKPCFGTNTLRGGNVKAVKKYKSLELNSADEALQGKISGLDLSASAAKANVATTSEIHVLYDMEVEEAFDEGEDVPAEPNNVSLRSDFSEAAFFYPHLTTDNNGDVQISFTLPESLTEWKFMAFAHDMQMNHGLITASAVAQKPFMVQPQMPRFVRVGDELNIATRIINQGSAELKGKAVVRILNAKTEKLIYTATQPFTVEASGTVAVTFPYTVKSGEDDLVCELTAVSGDNSDGERNLIPVLPSRMMVTESVPFYMENSGEKSIDLSALYNGNSPSAADKTMTLEYTDNPVWMVIDALRTVQTPSNNSASSLAAALYANSRLCELAESLRSYTDKQVVNVDSARARYDKALKLLEDLQCNDGSFRWFDGFERGNYYVTLLVAEHLSRMTDKPEMLAPALSYLDSVQVRNYEYCKANKMEIVPSESDLHYLLVCSRLPQRKVSTKAQKVRNIYLDYVEKNQKKLSIYGVSVSSVILRSFSRRSGADKLLNVVRHYLVNDKGQGLHFATKRALYSWYDYRIPTQVAAMQALYEANPADAALKDMQLWLLRQKQVQAWDCAENTCDVADLFLRISPLTSLRNGEKAHFAINGKNVVDRTPADDSVYFAHEMGYVNTPVEAEIYSQPVSTLNVSKTSEGISWGAVIVSFTDESSRMKAYSTGEVSISRRILVSEVDKEGKQSWRTLNAGETLRVGQKVRVRHTLKADRDMDFVCVKTLHPACFEPVEHISGYRCKGTEWCYQSIHDSYMELFFEKYREGTSTIDVDYYVTRPGVYNMGITSAECTYAKMFGGHSDGMTVSVVEK